MSENNDLIAAIEAQDIEKIKKLAQAEENSMLKRTWLHSHEISAAIKTANVKVIKTLVDIWTSESEYWNSQFRSCCESYSDEALVCLLKTEFASDEEKVSVLEYLLPHFYAKSPQKRKNLSVDLMFDFICQCWLFCPLFENYFLQKYYFSEERNSLYPLIKALQDLNVDENHAVSILLHSDIIYLDGIYFYASLMELAFKVFVKLILGTNEMMKLAIEILKVLLEKDIYEAFETITDDLWYIPDEEIEEETDPVSPFLLQRAFQFVYCTFNSQNFWKLNSLMKGWFELCCKNRKVSYLTCQAFIPFVISIPSLELDIRELILEHGFEKILRLFPQRHEGFQTLSRICQNMVKEIVVEAANHQPHEVIKRVWSLPLPETVKCEMLHLPDASWMNDLPDFD
ncbi:uncharacterized protein LOC134830965 [Culicoides brevitarsis]|uniref:uncharacterized protein LOC134830965 n=1 Tax=Culicoides brevitarsis TaxID=469753 RepID=UPI00307C1D07